MGIVLATTLGVAIWATACSNQAEGERCEIFNGNEDCETGLQCLPGAQVNPPFNSSDRCCPVDRNVATHPACTLLTAPIGGDSGPPPDTGPVPDATVDSSGGDTGTTEDASDDATADADDDGG